MVDENSRPQEAEAAKKKVDARLEECGRKASAFCNNLATKHNKFGNSDTIKQFNDKLRDRVLHVRGTIEYEKERLAREQKQREEELKATTEKIKSVLKERETEVNAHICREVTAVVREVKDKFRSILAELERISQTLRQRVVNLGKWIEHADAAVKAALTQVEKILDVVNENNLSSHPALIKSAVQQIESAVLVLHSSGEAARKEVKEKVTAALEAVKEMDDELKKDLYNVKDNIKRAITQLAGTLDTNVREGLTGMEKSITGPLGKIVASSTSFDEAFRKTKEVLTEAVGIVAGDIGNLKGLTGLNTIGKDFDNKLKLLKAIRGGKSFDKINEYFTNIEKSIMTPIKDAMDKITKAWDTIIGYGSDTYVKHAITVDRKRLKEELLTPLSTLKGIVDGSGPEFKLQELQKNLKEVGLELNGVTELKSKLKNFSTTITTIATPGNNISKDEAKNLLTDLGNIAKAVSEHSREVVENVMTEIQTKIKGDIGDVAGAVFDKIRKIQDGIDHDHESEADYGRKDKAKGLKALVKEFDTSIKGELGNLNETVTTQVFKKVQAPGFLATSSPIYAIGNELMNAFYGTYKTLHGGVLNNSSNQDILKAQFPDGGYHRVNIDKKIFGGYANYVNQESLEKAAQDTDQLKGALPEKIRKIRDEVTGALTTIDDFNDQAIVKFTEVSSNLSNLCYAVRNAAADGKDSAKTKLILLKETYFAESTSAQNSINKIHSDLSELQKKLESGPIKEAKRYLSHVDHSTTATINLLGNHVKREIETAQEALTTHATRQYVNALKTLLTEFAEKQRKVLEGLPDEIEKDLKIGYKGFMAKLGEQFVKKVEQIKTIE
ncbi:hypothetical protein, conserved [Babesia ovata]|uniref:Extracellular matrix-binding ebh n=1 Tax=Babesia ovata TaxID=189622 RepID=A0A2H6KKC4_9APIC|nr:uncharacterized protein BOVATA_049330 [Babesia ovata]GBE63440.1 hypothetical protein, conserved [Babesia ovata]